MMPTEDPSISGPEIQALILAVRRFTKAQMGLLGKTADLGLRPSELLLLHSMKRAQGAAAGAAPCGVNPSDLASRMGVTPGHVTQVLGALEREGMVERQIDSTDRRRILVTLTERGAAVLEEANARLGRAYEGLAGSLGEKDTKRFMALLEKAADHFSNQDGDQPCPHDQCPHGRFL